MNPPSVRIVATHGLGDDATTWSPLAERLRQAGIRVDTWDLAGHGEQAPPGAGRPYTIDDALGGLRRVVESGPLPAVLMGHSLGGYLSLRYTLDRPDQVAGLVLIATGPGYRSEDGRARWNDYLRRVAPTMGLASGVEEVALQHDATVIDGLADIDVPVVVLTGERDERFHAGGDHIAARVRHGTHEYVAGAGHHPHVAAADDVADRVREHVRPERDR